MNEITIWTVHSGTDNREISSDNGSQTDNIHVNNFLNPRSVKGRYLQARLHLLSPGWQYSIVGSITLPDKPNLNAFFSMYVTPTQVDEFNGF
jgi:hypothetical protein